MRTSSLKVLFGFVLVFATAVPAMAQTTVPVAADAKPDPALIEDKVFECAEGATGCSESIKVKGSKADDAKTMTVEELQKQAAVPVKTGTPMTIEDLNKVIDARLAANAASNKSDLDKAVGHVLSSKMQEVFDNANKLRDEGLEKEAEKQVRKAIGKDKYLAKAWDDAKKAADDKKKAADKQLELRKRTHMQVCGPETVLSEPIPPPSFFKVGNIVNVVNNYGPDVVKNVGIKYTDGTVIVANICKGGHFVLPIYMSFGDATQKSFHYTVFATTLDGRTVFEDSTNYTMNSYQAGYNRVNEDNPTWEIHFKAIDEAARVEAAATREPSRPGSHYRRATAGNTEDAPARRVTGAPTPALTRPNGPAGGALFARPKKD